MVLFEATFLLNSFIAFHSAGFELALQSSILISSFLAELVLDCIINLGELF